MADKKQIQKNATPGCIVKSGITNYTGPPKWKEGKGEESDNIKKS